MTNARRRPRGSPQTRGRPAVLLAFVTAGRQWIFRPAAGTPPPDRKPEKDASRGWHSQTTSATGAMVM